MGDHQHVHEHPSKPAQSGQAPSSSAPARFLDIGLENSHRESKVRVIARVECPSPVYIMHESKALLAVLPCKRRRCPVCGPGRWKPYQQARYMSGLEKVRPDLLKVFTLTAPGSDKLPGPREIYLWNEQAGECWERFVRLLRAEYPQTEIELWKVWEHQERGALHCHGILRGLRWIPMETFRAIAVAAGFGPRIQLERCKVERGGVRGLLGYFSKYLLKAVNEWRYKRHVITASHGWAIDWRRRNEEKRASEWVWLSARDAGPLLAYYVPVDTWQGGRVDVLGPPGEANESEGR